MASLIINALSSKYFAEKNWEHNKPVKMTNWQLSFLKRLQNINKMDCMIPECNSYSGGQVPIYNFPNNDHVRSIWKSNMTVKNPGYTFEFDTTTSKLCLCANHFESNQFQKFLRRYGDKK